MSGLVEEMLDGRHLLERALADLVLAYQRQPHPALAGTIEVVRAEIALVGTVLKLRNADCDLSEALEPSSTARQTSTPRAARQ
jgi:hypothetical protein